MSGTKIVCPSCGKTTKLGFTQTSKLNQPLFIVWFCVSVLLVGLTIFVVNFIRHKRLAAPKQLSALVVSEERKVFLYSKEMIRRSLKNPTDAKFYAPYKGLTIVSNDVADVSDVNEIATRLHSDYWFSTGLVDAYAKVGNKERVEWKVILEDQSNAYRLVFSEFGDKKEGSIPRCSKLEQKHRDELDRQLRLARENEMIEKEKERIRWQLESERLKQQALKEQALRLQQFKEEQKRQIDERIKEFRELQLRANINTGTTNRSVIDSENNEELRQVLAQRLISSGIYVEWRTNSVSEIKAKELEWYKQQEDLNFNKRSFGSGIGR